jgi:hypothetical protein
MPYHKNGTFCPEWGGCKSPECDAADLTFEEVPLSYRGSRTITQGPKDPPPAPTTPSASGKKNDTDKNRLDLLEPTFIEEMGRVMTFGAKKYSADNWRGGLHYRRLIGAALRHIFAFARGEAYDKETGTSHLANAGCCLMMLYWTWVNRPDLDDRKY